MPGSTRNIRLHASTTEDGRGLLALERDVRRAADGVDKAGAAADRTGKRFRGFEGDTRGLSRELDITTDSVRRLHAEIARTGDRSLFGDLRREESYLRRLRQLSDDLVPGNQAAGTGLFGIAARGRMGMYLNVARAAVVATPIILPLASMFAAAIGGAVVGAVGAGGVIGGIALAADDPRVKSGFGELGRSVLAGLRDDAEVFTDPILGQLLPDLRASWERMRPDLRQFFAESAKLVDPLAKALGGFAEELAPGLAAAARAALPVMEMLSRELPELGDDISGFFEAIERNAPEAANALGNVLDMLGGMIRGTGITMDAASAFWENYRQDWWRMLLAGPAADLAGGQGMLSEAWKAGRDALREHAAWVPGRGIQSFGEDIDAATAKIREQRYQLDLLGQTIDTVFGRGVSADQARLTVERGWEHLGKALSDDNLTQREGVSAQMEKVLSARDRLLAEPGADPMRVTRWYDDQINRIVAMGRAAGVTETALSDLAGEYKIEVAFAMTIAAAMGLKNLVAKGFSTVANTFAGAFATGGSPPVGQPYWVGERGPELRFDTSPGYIVDHNTSMAMARGGNGGVVELRVLSDGSAVGEALTEILRTHVRVAYNGDATLALSTLGR